MNNGEKQFQCYGIIPARYASSRFPAKPLADILGKPMFWHVYQRASRCVAFASGGVWLATDDVRIADAAQALAVPCLMTSPDLESGSDRVHAAACALDLHDDVVVVNIQGDEPCLDPRMLDALVQPFVDPLVRVATLASPLSEERARSADQVKVVLAANGDALYFSRACIPFARDAGIAAPLLGHVGIYAFRMEALRRFTSLPASLLEHTEKLEQLRLLENNIPIRVVRTLYTSHGVDRPEDLDIVRALLMEGESA